MILRRAQLCTILAVTLGACSGNITDSTPASAGSGGKGDSGGIAGMTGPAGHGGGGGSPTPVAGPSAGPLTLRRLSRSELDNTLNQLLGIPATAADGLPSDGVGESGFLSGNQVSTVDADGLVGMAETVAATAVMKLTTLTGCDPSKADETTCAKQFIATFGKRAFRRPLEATETAGLEQLYSKLRTDVGLDYAGAISFVLQGILQSPSFLYHWEVGPSGDKADGALVKLGGYELASRLSYFLWESMPDDALFASADSGKLLSSADVEREARRMLLDSRAKKAILDFHNQWLKLGGAADLQKGSDFPAGSAAADEVTAFVDYVMSGDGRLPTLLSAPVGFGNAAMAQLYGVTGITGSAVQKLNLDPTQRAGILTQSGFLALNAKGADSEAIYRGVVVLERLLCEQKPPPLAAIPMPMPPTADISTRQRHIEHETNPVCVACHQSFEPLGFAFENYDGLGRWRSSDGGKPVDASGMVTTQRGQETFVFKNAVELAKALSTSPQVQACATAKVFRFSSGRAESDADAAALTTSLATFRKSGLDMRELMVAVTTSQSFLYRAPAEGEVLR